MVDQDEQKEYSQIIDIPLFETTHPSRILIICLGVVIKGQLDVDILKSSFTKLMVHWPRLGGRLTSTKDWKVSICIPASLDSNSFSFTTSSREDEKIIPSLPQKCPQVDAKPICDSHPEYFQDSNTPKSCSEILKGDKLPTSYVHVTSFKDATCIGLTLPHVMYDAMGLCEVMHEWCNILGGKPLREQIMGDPLKDITSIPYPKTKLELEEFQKKRFGTIQLFGKVEFVLWLARFFYDCFRHPSEKTSLIFIPQSHIDRVREKAKTQGHWISENDVVTALLFQLGLKRYKSSYNEYMSLVFLGNMRGAIPTLPKDGKSVYLGSVGIAMSVPAERMKETRQMDVIEVAINLRKAIEAQRDIEQLKMAGSLWCELARSGFFIRYHKTGGDYYCVTSWAKGNMYDFDFSPALKKRDEQAIDTSAADEHDGVKAGQVLHADGSAGQNLASKRGWCVLFGKSSNGKEVGYWSDFTAPMHAWPAVDEEMQSWWAESY